MQQRLWSYSYSYRVVPEDHAAAAMRGAAPPPPQLNHHQHASRTGADCLPVHYDHRSGVEKKGGSSRPPAAEKWVHAIPLIVVFCFLVLWWSSVSVKVVSFEPSEYRHPCGYGYATNSLGSSEFNSQQCN